MNPQDVTRLLRDTGLFDAGLSARQPPTGFTVDQVGETRATVHYLGAEPDRTQARLERAATTLEAGGYAVERYVDDGRYYLDVTRHANDRDPMSTNGA